MTWEGENEALRTASRQPGSRLKTPGLPIWVTCCCGHYGIIFNSNRELLRNYHAEKRFDLHHYTCAGCYLPMTVDNRGQDDSTTESLARQGSFGGGGSCNSEREQKRDDIVATPLERLIHSKWMEAKITFQGPAPSSLSY